MKGSLSFLLLFVTLAIFCQNNPQQKDDLKVGLVLSGGGAKGFAHVGALKVLEEAGIRIDYIGGTSMGAIIGALYSSGYRASELDSILQSYDFTELMQDNLPRRTQSIYQKENTEKYALSLPIKEGSVGLPRALSKGQNVFNELSKLTEHIHAIEDFSMLPIPFFCVTTDLETGDEVILERGFLPEAVKASGAFPTLLDPVEIDGNLYVDGGIVNNFPTDIMRNKGVDIVIGIDVQDKLKVKGNLDSAPSIIMQIVNFQMYDDEQLKKSLTDLYIHPDIRDFNVVSFDDITAIIQSGQDEAMKELDKLKAIAAKQAPTRDFIIDDVIRFKRNNLVIDKVVIEGTENYTDEYVLGKLGIKKGEAFTYDQFASGINQLSATDNFKSIQYKFIDSKTVSFKLKESDIASFVKIGAHFDDLYKTAALLNVTSKHLLFDNDVISADLILGDNIRYKFDYFIDNGFHWSYGFRSRYNHFDKSIFKSTFERLEPTESNTKERTRYNDFTNQVYVQSAISNAVAIRLGAETKYLRIFTESITNDQEIKNFYDNSTYGNAFAEVKVDTYDKALFPKKGFFLDASYKGYLVLINDNGITNNFTPFTQLRGRLGFAHTFGDKLTAHVISEGGITIGENDNRVHNFHLGGNNENFVNNFTSFLGYDVGDLSGQGYLKSALTLRYELFKKNHLSFTANAARAEEDIFNEGRVFENTRLGYGIGYSIESFLGPLEIKYTWSPDTSNNIWFFNLGFWF